MFKNIEISVINKKAVLASSWAEFGAICVLGYFAILIFLLTNVDINTERAALNLVFGSLIILAYFLYASFFYWATFFLVDWLIERFFITRSSGEKTVHIILGIEVVIVSAVMLITHQQSFAGDLWPVGLTIFITAKIVRLIILKQKNRMLNHI